MSYQDGTLVKADGESAVYLILAGAKQSFVSGEQFLNMGKSWKNVLTVSAGELSHYIFAGDVKYPDGTLVQTKDNPNGLQSGT